MNRKLTDNFTSRYEMNKSNPTLKAIEILKNQITFIFTSVMSRIELNYLTKKKKCLIWDRKLSFFTMPKLFVNNKKRLVYQCCGYVRILKSTRRNSTLVSGSFQFTRIMPDFWGRLCMMFVIAEYCLRSETIDRPMLPSLWLMDRKEVPINWNLDFLSIDREKIKVCNCRLFNGRDLYSWPTEMPIHTNLNLALNNIVIYSLYIFSCCDLQLAIQMWNCSLEDIEVLFILCTRLKSSFNTHEIRLFIYNWFTRIPV